LRELGYESEIFVEQLDEPMRELGFSFQPGAIGAGDGLVYHHSIGSTLTPFAMKHPGPKALVYHNITPARFFQPWNPAFARLLEKGRNDLPGLASSFPVSCGDSTFNATELREAGFRDPGVMPIFVDPLRWAQPADSEWMRTLQ